MKILVFAGGTGSRLWPLSRKEKPKQFQKIIGDKTFVQNTIDNLSIAFDIKDVYISAPSHFEPILEEQLPDFPENNLILEPSIRDTFASVGYAAYFLGEKFPEENVITLWSDHSIKHPERLLEIFKTADRYSTLKNKIVKIDVNPSSPNTNLGYIMTGNLIEKFEDFDVFEFIKQIEKPDENTAKQFLESTHYLWHTGYNVWPKGKLLDLYKKYQPEVYSILEEMFKTNDLSLYEKIPKLSIDYAILQKVEKTDFVEMPADLGWRDVGTWESVYDELSTSKDDNVTNASTCLIDSERNILYSTSKGKKICAIGLHDMAVVDTGDVIFISSIKDTNRLKEIIKKLEEDDPSIL